MDFQLGYVENVTGTAVDKREDGTWVWAEAFDLTALLNVIIGFINKLIRNAA